MDKERPPLHRSIPWASLEVLLGILLGVGAIVPLVAVVAGIVGLISRESVAIALVTIVVGAALLAWCVQTTWRLITGRPRKDRMLLSPTATSVFGLGVVALGVYGFFLDGRRLWGTGVWLVLFGGGFVIDSWRRLRRGRSA